MRRFVDLVYVRRQYEVFGAAETEERVARKRKEEAEGFEARLARLEELVAKLEAGNLPLEDAVAVFEEGMGLAKSLAAALADAERRIETLLLDQGGQPTLKPFVEEEDDADDATDEEPHS
jgi:exodeoxyribonuclease VII small subunit